MTTATSVTRKMSLPNRAAFARLCNERGIMRAAEVGTDRGIFAEEFLHQWKGEILICVDHWAPYQGMPYDRTADLAMAVQLLAPFRRRVKLMRGDARVLAPVVGHGYLPKFVYIDGDHEYESVRGDIEAWWPHVQPGGIFAGHDYMPDHGPVVRAVDEFAAAHGLTVHLTEDLNEYRSWFVEKPV